MEATVSIHDRYQIEFKLGYSLPFETPKTSYDLDLYVFTPRSLGINPETYTKQQFYIDMQSYLRIKTPSVSLSQFENGKDSPIVRLRSVIETTANIHSQKPPKEYENQIKLFCCIFKSAIRDFVSYIKETAHEDDRERLLVQFVESVRLVSTRYRALQPLIQTPGVVQRTFELFLFGDEYLSLLIEEHTFNLIEVLSASVASLSADSKSRLLALVDDEVQYRRRRGYASLPKEQDANETLIFRKSVLKKYMASILFLNTAVHKEGFFLEQTLFGLAAAVSMFFATSVAFISQSVYGTLSLPVFLALVISYIFKDRIKDLLRFYLSRKMTRALFDHKTRIHDDARNVVGYCKESFEFIGDRKLPKEVRDLRNRSHITEIENGWVGEQTLLYRKRMRLYPAFVRRIFSNIEISGVNDIIRFNIQEFLRKMDDPKKDLFVMDEVGFHRINGSRVYHLNIIIKTVHDRLCSYVRYRVVLNRKGIKRIEKCT